MLVGCGKLFSHGVQGRPGDDGGTVKMLQCNIPSFSHLSHNLPSPLPLLPHLPSSYSFICPSLLSLAFHMSHTKEYMCA